jgi:hypothetical protein
MWNAKGDGKPEAKKHIVDLGTDVKIMFNSPLNTHTHTYI